MLQFSKKHTSENILLGIDYTNRLITAETITSATVSITSLNGTDTNASSVISGNPIITGAIIQQKIVNGVPGASYVLTFLATTSGGRVLEAVGAFEVRQ